MLRRIVELVRLFLGAAVCCVGYVLAEIFNHSWSISLEQPGVRALIVILAGPTVLTTVYFVIRWAIMGPDGGNTNKGAGALWGVSMALILLIGVIIPSSWNTETLRFVLQNEHVVTINVLPWAEVAKVTAVTWILLSGLLLFGLSDQS